MDLYRTDPTSALHRVKRSTRIRDYEPSLRVVVKTVGDRRIDNLRASDLAYRIPDIGPVVIDEDHWKPYWENRYAEKFRKVRDAAGAPSNVWSMDSRAGAVSETVETTGSLEAARDLATSSEKRKWHASETSNTQIL